VAEVSTGEPRHGRRDNGLVASEYAAVGDVDPRVGEHLLDVLGLDGIAAYLRPSSDLNPVTRSNSLPGRPTDRLYVDRAHVATARDYVRRLAEAEEADGPGGLPTDAPSLDSAGVDAAWAEIVAGYDLTAAVERPRRDPTAHPGPTGSVGEAIVRDGTEARPEPRPESRPETARPSWVRLPPPGAAPRNADPEEPSLLEGLDTFGSGYDDEEGYTPPQAPPIPRPSMPAVLAVLGIVGGLIVFLAPELLPMSERGAMLLGFTAVVSGFATLVWRLRPGDDDDEHDSDDGARV
jgi:hypothetical protein